MDSQFAVFMVLPLYYKDTCTHSYSPRTKVTNFIVPVPVHAIDEADDQGERAEREHDSFLSENIVSTHTANHSEKITFPLMCHISILRSTLFNVHFCVFPSPRNLSSAADMPATHIFNLSHDTIASSKPYTKFVHMH